MNISKAALLQMLAGIILSASGAEFYEDFQGAPNLSEDWTYGICTNTTLGSYSGENSQFVDRLTSSPDERTSLQIAKQEKASGEVRAEILSPIASTNISEWSCYIKRANGNESSTQLRVWGRSEETAEWSVLYGPEYPINKNTWLTNAVSFAANIRQVKFEIFGGTDNWRNCALDSLRIRAGENQASGDEDDPSDPASPTKPTKLKLEATAPDVVAATWQGVPGEDGYLAELFQVEDRRETDVPDFSGLASNVWPSGWMYADLSNGYGWYSSDKLIKVNYNNCWFASPPYSQPITRFEYKFKSNKDSLEVENTKLVVWVSKKEEGDDWVEFDRRQVSASMSTVVSDITTGEGIRRIKFSVDYSGSDMSYASALLLGVNVLSITCGEVVSTSEGSCTVAEPTATFSNLNVTASYRVTVQPTPSDDPALVATSDVLDLSKEHFRETGALPVTLENLTYEERFDSLSNFVTQTKTAKMNLDYWQFVLDGAEPEALGLSLTNKTPQNAGCYVCRDGDTIDSAMIGTLASGEKGCAIGLALRNDTDRTLHGPKVTFDSVQRSFKSNSCGYRLEWRVTDSETSTIAAGDWQEVDIPQTAPYTEEDRGEMPEFRQRDIVATIPAKLPAGNVLRIRWRHPKTTSGPMMAIDNVRIAFDKPSGLYIFIK